MNKYESYANAANEIASVCSECHKAMTDYLQRIGLTYAEFKKLDATQKDTINKDWRNSQQYKTINS